MSVETLPSKPLLKPWYRLATDEGRLLLEHGHSVVVFEGEAATRLLPPLLALLDGSRGIDELTSALGPAVAPAVLNALRLLGERGLLLEGYPTASHDGLREEAAQAIVAAGSGSGGVDDVLERLAALRLGIGGRGQIAEEVARLLRLTGATVEPVEADGSRVAAFDLVVVAPDSAELRQLERWNRLALDEGFPWLQVLPFDGRFAAIGPLFVPRETCCLECYRLRRAANVDCLDEYRALEGAPAFYPVGPIWARTIAGLAVSQALRWLVGGDAYVPGLLFTLELSPALQVRHHHVFRVPRCPACSETSGAASPHPWFQEGTSA